jgi:tRNA pseudouridine38-40 synthase
LRNILLSLEYDGTAYHGWQRQANGITIQEVLENCLSRMTQESIKTMASSRTDAGVHALDQKVNFKTQSMIPLKAFHLGLNSLLPFDIRVVAAEEVSPDFMARKAAKQKTYSYTFAQGTHLPTLMRHQCWFLTKDIHWEKVEFCFRYLQGQRDFKSFQAADCEATQSLRTIDTIQLTNPIPNSPARQVHFTRLTFQGKSFLKHMIRNIVGTLYWVGLGKISEENFAQIVEAKDRTLAGPCAPARGLVLEKVSLS